MDYTSEMSATLDVGSAANAELAMAMFERMANGLQPLEPEGNGADEEDEGIGDDLGLLVELDERPGLLWLQSDFSLNASNLATYVLACAVRFNLSGLWHAEIADTASKPVVDAFGGAFIVLDLSARTVLRTGGTCDEVRKTREAHAALASGPNWLTEAVERAVSDARAACPQLGRQAEGDLRIEVAAALAGGTRAFSADRAASDPA